MTPGLIADVLESCWGARDEIVPCFLGAPGIGKTQGIYEFAEKKGAKVVEIIASQILPNEVSGITMPRDDTHSMEIYDHARLASLKDGDILFFDELLQASTQTLSACLTLIQERRMMSGKKLPDIMIVAAANPLNSPSMIPESIRQRFMFMKVTYNESEWRKYIRGKYDVYDISKLVALIDNTTAPTYNRVTPRTAEKLIKWHMTAKENNTEHIWFECVSNMFDYTTASEIKAALSYPEEIERVVGALEHTLDASRAAALGHVIKNMSLKDMLSFIESLPEADKIIEALKGETVL